MITHGFRSEFATVQTNTATDTRKLLIPYILSAFMAILGYGLVISFSSNGSIVGMYMTLLVVAITAQLSSLLQELFFKYSTNLI